MSANNRQQHPPSTLRRHTTRACTLRKATQANSWGIPRSSDDDDEFFLSEGGDLTPRVDRRSKRVRPLLLLVLPLLLLIPNGG
jgi:hypothetical protein